MDQKSNKRERRHKRVRAKVFGTSGRPRLSVFRSNRFMYGQVIDDSAGRTLIGAHSQKSAAKSDAARALGRELAQRALARNIKRVVFDRGGYQYHGRIKALAEGAREAGLMF